MAKQLSYQIIEHGKPLELRTYDVPVPHDEQILIRVTVMIFPFVLIQIAIFLINLFFISIVESVIQMFIS